jgi:acetyl esterase/lipase
MRRTTRAIALALTVLSVLSLPATAVASALDLAEASGAAATVSGTASATSSTKATVNVAVDAVRPGTRYYVEYGTTTRYGHTTRAAFATTGSTINRAVYLSGLSAGTVYHYRVVAATPFGATVSADQIVSTWPDQIPFLSKGEVSANNVTTAARGSRTGKSPVGWVLLIHGGGWQDVGSAELATETSKVKFFTGLGWATDDVDYRKGEHSLPDVLAAYDALRKKVGSSTPICLAGQSAGGNLALLVAEHRTSVDCVISEAGPTDLVHITDQKAYPLSGSSVEGPAYAYQATVVPSFGVQTSVLKQWSPVADAGAITARVLLGASAHDSYVPQVQMKELKKAMRRDGASGSIKTVELAGGAASTIVTANFTHASVTKKALAQWRRDQRRLLAAVA